MHPSQAQYIDGRWVTTPGGTLRDVVNPATEQPVCRVQFGTEQDVDTAVAAAHAAFESYSQSTPARRQDLLRAIAAEYRRRSDDLAEAITTEMGAPVRFALTSQVGLGLAQLTTAADALTDYSFAIDRGATRILREPVGVCALITPWNWPLNQIACKVGPALAMGCTMVLKPSESAPLSAQIFTEVLHTAGVPAGVFNLVNGTGPTVGAALSRHDLVAMVSITGSNQAGVAVAASAAPTVKRVHQELGGKAPFIVVDDHDLPLGVRACVASAMNNAGQSCNAPTRLLVPESRLTEATNVAAQAAREIRVGDPTSDVDMGPVASRQHWMKIQSLIQAGLQEGATIAAGGPGRPSGLERGFFVRPTIFTGVSNEMRIAREEIFGPVLAILAYRSVEHAIEIANDTDYGLAGYVFCADRSAAREIAARLRVGQVRINGAPGDLTAPFGGYKRSGNGREWGSAAFDEYTELKSVMGYHLEGAR